MLLDGPFNHGVSVYEMKRAESGRGAACMPKNLFLQTQYRRAKVGTKALFCSSTCDHLPYLLYLVVLRGKFYFRLKNRINHIIFYTQMVEGNINSILFYSILFYSFRLFWAQIALVPFQGPKKSRFSGPTPSNAHRNDVAPLKIITYCAIKQQVH